MKRLSYFALLVLLTTWGCMEKSQEVVSPALEYIDVPFSLGGGGSVEIVSGGRVADDPAMILDEFFTDSLYFRFYTDDGLVDEDISILKTGTVITLPRVQGNIGLSNFPFDNNGNIAEYTFYPGILIAPDIYELRDSILFSQVSFVPGTSSLSFDLMRLDGKLTIRLSSDVPLDVSFNIENAFGFEYDFDGGEAAWTETGYKLSLIDFIPDFGLDLPWPFFFDRGIFDPASPSYNPNGGSAFLPPWRASPDDLTIILSDDYGNVFTWTNSKEVFFPGIAKEMIVNINYNSGAGQAPTANISIEGDVSSFTEEVQTIEFGNSFCFAKYDEASLIANDWLFSRVQVPEINTPDKFVSYTEASAANYISGGPITTELGTGYNYGAASPPIYMKANNEINVQFESLNTGTYEDPIVYSVSLWNTATDVYSVPIEVQSLSGIEILTTYTEFDGTYRIVAFAKLTGVSENQVAFTDFCLNKSPGTIFSADFENDSDASKFPFQYTHTTGSHADPTPSNFTPNSILNSTNTSGAVDDQLTDGDSFAWQFSNIPYTANQSYTKVIATNPMSLKAGDQISALFMQLISTNSTVNHRIYLWETSDNSAFAHEAVSTPVQTADGSYILQTTVPSDGNYILVLATSAYSSGTVIASVDDILITRQ